MNCANCGTALGEGARFCAHCGTPVQLACRSCGAELSAGQNFCPTCGTPTAADSVAGGDGGSSLPALSSVPVSERRVTSVLFGDLVGFTALSESRDPEEVRELLGRYFDSARQIVARYGGTIEKFIGDAVMAVWGVPTAHEDDAERAVRAGLDLVEAVTAFGESVGAPGLAMRVGIVTGEVAVTVGATNQGMVAGDAVNTASRVQAKADPGTVWVDAQTRSLTSGSIDFEPAGSHELKGKAEPVELFAATAVRGGVGGERSSDRVQAPLVGRRRELSVLKEMFHASAEEGRPRLVLLTGDAGVGKTRLSRELENYIDGLSAEVLWHRGRCLAYGEGVAFSALTSAVRARIGATEDDAENATRDKLLRALETYVSDAAERDWLSPALASLLGLPGAGGLEREELFTAWLTWFERLSALDGDPIAWIVDDAHYADDGLLDFVEHVLAVAQIPMLVVLLARPELLERRPGLAALRRTSVTGLETLSNADIAALFDDLVEGLPTDVRNGLVDRAEGVPLFAIETVRAMHDQGLAVDGPTRRPGALRLATGVGAETLDALAAPASLQVLVASRLDLLPPAERSVLAAASVLGQTFTLGALAATSGHAGDLAQVLRELIRRDLLTTITDRLSAEEGQYAFVQTVVRSVAYQTQSRKDRLQRHLDVVAYLESMADTDGTLSAVIAQHLRDALSLVGADDPQHAELAGRLGQWLRRSAVRSREVGAPSDAVRAFAEAMTLATDPSERVELQVAAADAALAAGALDDCIDYALPVATGQLDADHTEVADALATALPALRWSGRSEEAWTMLQPYLADGALDDLPSRTAARLAREIGTVLDSSARTAEGAVWTERALSWAEDAGDPREIGQTLISSALGHYLRGQARIGQVLLGYSAEFARENRLGSELGRALVNQLAFGLNRDLDAALSAGEEAMGVTEQIGDVGMGWHTAINVAIGLMHAGRWDEIATLLDRPMLQSRPPEPPQAAIVEVGLAVIASARGEDLNLPVLETLAVLGETDESETPNDGFYALIRAMLSRATGDAESFVAACRRAVTVTYKFLGLDDDFPNIWSVSVGALIEAGEYDVARELMRIVTDNAPSRWPPMLAAQMARLRGTLEALDPESDAEADDVEQDLLTGVASLDAVGAHVDQARAQAALGTWLTKQGRASEAAPHLAAARETFERLRATAWLRALDSDLALSVAG